jgi:protein phosphatase
VAARTDVGRIRAGNEDSLYADANASRGLFIVADGMGGHAAGEVASAMAVQIIARELDGTEAVVPMPCLSLSREVRSKIARLASRSARSMRPTASSTGPERSSSSRAMICTAMALATSPAACPPMPSATMNSPRLGVASA